jgi:hypothetical protein
MKSFSLIAAVAVCTPLMSFASTMCQGMSLDHTFTVSQKLGDVEVTLEDEKLKRYSDLKDTTEGSLQISGKNTTYVLVQNITVDDLLKKKSLSRSLVVRMIAMRPEFNGDQDLWYSYAGSLLSSLKCN